MLFRLFFAWWDDLDPFHRVMFMCAMVVIAIAAAAGTYSITEEGREQTDAVPLALHGSEDRLYCETYCRQGQAVLVEFSNDGRHTSVFSPPECVCLAAELTGDPE